MKGPLRLVIILINQYIIYSFARSDYIIFSIDNTTSSYISHHTSVIINSVVYDNSLIIGKAKLVNLKSPLFKADKNQTVKLQLYYANKDIATDYSYFKYILKKSSSTKIVSYLLTYTIANPQSVISSTKITNNTISSSLKSDQLGTQCNYSIGELTFELLQIESKDNYIKMVHYSFLTFAFDKHKGKVDYIYYFNNTIYIKDIFKSKASEVKGNNTIKDMWIIDQEFHSNTYLCLLLSNNTLLLYEIKLFDEYNFSLNLFNSININKTEPNIICPFVGFAIIHYFPYMSSQLVYVNKRGVYSLIKDNINSNDNENDKWITYCLIDIGNQGKEISDFIINKKSVYLLINNSGIEIYSIISENSFKLVRSLEHPNMISLHAYKNPYYGYYFIGVELNQTQFSSEFYIELFAQDELNPRVNKVLISEKDRLMINHHSNVDAFFAYFFDKTKKEMIMIRKGMLNSIPFLTYKISLEKMSGNNFINAQLFSIENHHTGLHIPMLVFNNSIFLIDNITLPNHYISCSFSETGNYSIITIQKGEISLMSQTHENINSDSLSVYQNIIEYTFDVSEYKGYSFTWVIKVSFSLLMLNILGVLLVFAIKTNCFVKKMPMKRSNIDKTNKQLLYGDSLVTSQDIEKSKFKENVKREMEPKMKSDLSKCRDRELNSDHLKKSEETNSIHQQTDNNIKSESIEDELFESPAREQLTKKIFHMHNPSQIRLKQDNERNIEEDNYDDNDNNINIDTTSNVNRNSSCNDPKSLK